MDQLAQLIAFSIPVAVGIYGWKFYSSFRLNREFEELRFSNPNLYEKIVHEACSYSNYFDQSLVDELGPQIWADYKKGFKAGLTVKKIYKQRRQTSWGPY